MKKNKNGPTVPAFTSLTAVVQGLQEVDIKKELATFNLCLDSGVQL